MILLNKKQTDGRRADATVTLTFEQRVKSRQRVRLDNGLDAGLFLDRGTILHDGDVLQAEDGYRVEIRAAAEDVSTAHGDSRRLMALACYHIGNRHVPVQIGDGWIRYQADHVLDRMIQGLGLRVIGERVPFEPEAGAYHAHGHHHE